MRTTLSLVAVLALTLLVSASAFAQNPELSISVDTASPGVGETVTFTIGVQRNGGNINNVVVAMTEGGLDYVSHSVSQGSYDIGTDVWTVGNVNGNPLRTLTLVMSAPALGSYTVEADVTGPSAGDHAEITITAVAPPTLAEVCYGIADSGGSGGGDDRLLRIIRATGASSPIGAGTGTDGIESGFFDAATNTLYAANGGTLGRVNTTSGVYTSIGAAGTGGGSASEIALNNIDGLTLDPFTRTVYAVHRRDSADDLLFAIDSSTGAHIADFFGAGVDYVVVPSTAAVGFGDIDDIAVDPATGLLYGIANNGGSGDRLVTINKTTGAVTDVGAVGQDDVEGLSFTPDGSLFGSVGSAAAANSNSLLSINKTTGVGTITAAFNGGTDVEAVSCLTNGVNTLGGMVYEDAGADATYVDGTDTPQDGATVYLWRDNNGDGLPGTGNDVLVGTTTTDATGAYAFTITAEGDFVVEVDGSTAPSGAGWTTDESHTASFTGFGTTITGLDFAFATETDLELSMSVDEPAPDAGDTVTFTLTLSNTSVTDATNVQVSAPVIARADTVEVAGSTPSVGTFDNTFWNVGTLAAGQTATLTVQVRLLVDALGYTYLSEVATMSEVDIDSTPFNDITAEDDYASASAATGGSTSGGEGGLESNGGMAEVLARVLYSRRQTNAVLADAGIVLEPAPFVAQRAAQHSADAKQGSVSLADLFPDVGPANSYPVEVSPFDLLPVTNAESVIAADYLRPSDGRRMAVVFGTTTRPGEVYEHTKVVCDRLRGATLEGLEYATLHGHPFVLARLRYPDGSLDYALSFVAYEKGAGMTVDSRFLLREYATDGTGETVNVQVWSVSRAYTLDLASRILDGIAEAGPVDFRNTPEAPPTLPQTFVRRADYIGGALRVEMHNGAGSETLFLRGGTMARTEQGTHVGFERTAALPSQDGSVITSVTIPTGPLFDVAFFAETDAENGADLLYLADGAWGFAEAPSGADVTAFDVQPEPDGPVAEGTRPVERPVRLAGDVTQWAGIFRYLRPGGGPVDLTAYQYVEFTAWGDGAGAGHDVRVLLEKASVTTSDHFGSTLTFTTTPTTYRLWFDDLRQDGEGNAFTADDLVVLSFYLYGDGVSAQPFALNVENVRFGGAEGDLDALPDTPTLAESYPNPFRASTTIQFSIPDAQSVRLAVYDLLGRQVAVLAEGDHEAGRHAVALDGNGLASGVYVYRLETNTGTVTQRMTHIR